MICLGIGGVGTSIARDDAFRLFDAWVESAGRAFDTAHVYGAWEKGCEGASERILGEWLTTHGVRDQTLVSTKGGHPPLSDMDAKRVTPECLQQDLEESLERLQFDAVDVYWLHRDDPDVPVEELVDWLRAAREAGRVRAYGVSNWTATRIAAFLAAAEERGEREHVAGNQVGFSLAVGPTEPILPGCLWMDDDTMAVHASASLPCWAYSCQAGGFFKSSETTAPAGKEVFAWAWENPENLRRRDAARRIAKQHGVDANAIAVAWLLARPFPVTPIVGCRTPEQARASIAAERVRLSDEEIAELGA